MNAWKAAKSGISAIRPTRFEPVGSENVRTAMPIDPKTSSRLGEAFQASTSSTSCVIRYVATANSFDGETEPDYHRRSLLIPEFGDLAMPGMRPGATTES